MFVWKRGEDPNRYPPAQIYLIVILGMTPFHTWPIIIIEILPFGSIIINGVSEGKLFCLCQSKSIFAPKYAGTAAAVPRFEGRRINAIYPW